jgi:ATP-dependent DNA ligase
MNIDLLQQIKDTGSTNEKKVIAENLNKETHQYLEYCFNDTVYGISKTSILKALGYNKELHGSLDDAGEFFDKVEWKGTKSLFSFEDQSLYTFLESIKNTSGIRQQELLASRLSDCDSKLRKWWVRCLMKNPRIGMNLSSYNKVRGKLGMKLIEKHWVKLAEPHTKKKFKELVFPVIGETKFDGNRNQLDIDNRKITCITRQGNDVTSKFPEVVAQAKDIIDNQLIDYIILDGEIVSTSFNAIQGRVSKKDEDIVFDEEVHMVIYDILEVNGIDLRNKPFSYRREQLEKYVDEKYLSETTILTNWEELWNLFDKSQEEEQEGIMVKELHNLYEDDRKGIWKVKPSDEYDLVVIDYKYGEGKYRDVVSSLQVTSNCEKIKCWVGSGLNDDLRLELTEMAREDDLIDKIIEVKYTELIVQDNNKFSLRHPRFVRFRNDRSVANDK